MVKKVLDILLIVAGLLSLLSGLGYLIEGALGIDSSISFSLVLLVSLALTATLILLWVVHQRKLFKLEDQNTKYSIHILNENGDAIVKRKVDLRVHKGVVSKREHTAFSDGGIMSKEEMHLRAWDTKGNELFCEFIFDQPTTKRFNIIFAHPVSRREMYSYSYQFEWRSLFNAKSDYYLLQDTSLEAMVSIIAPSKWNLQSIEAVEVHRDGTLHNLKVDSIGVEREGPANNMHGFIIHKKTRHPQVRVEWRFE